MSSLEFAYGLGSGLAAAGGLYGLLWWLARRAKNPRPERSGPPLPLGPLMGPAVEVPATDLNTVAPRPAQVGTGPGPSVGPSNARAVSGPRDLAEADPRHPPQRGSVSPPATLRLSQRVILHVYSEGVQHPGEVAAPGLCQAGMGAALGVPQSGLAAVLRRLEAAGVLLAERGHVRGHARRLKVYRLSARGLELAAELRSRAHRRKGT